LKPLTSDAADPPRRAALIATALWVAMPVNAGVTDAAGALRCRLTAPATGRPGEPLMLHFAFTNRGPRALRLLTWNTPLEPGWFAPFVSVTRDGEPLEYRGAMMKRGAPAPDDYLEIGAHRTRRAEIDLALAFDLSRPGRYRVEPRLVLHDLAAVDKRRARATDARAPQPLACNAVDFMLG
jgi:hypothetical protein